MSAYTAISIARIRQTPFDCKLRLSKQNQIVIATVHRAPDFPALRARPKKGLGVFFIKKLALFLKGISALSLQLTHIRFLVKRCLMKITDLFTSLRVSVNKETQRDNTRFT